MTEPHVLNEDGTCPHGCDYAKDGDRYVPHRYPEHVPPGDAAQIEILAAYIANHVPGEPSRSEGAGETAIRIIEAQQYRLLAHLEAKRDLIDAIVHTVEYVGLDQLPARPGWSWYDALSKHDPETLALLLERVPINQRPAVVGPHEFDRYSWLRPRTCRACWLDRDDHPVTGWTPARAIGDPRPTGEQSTSTRPIRRPGRHR